MLTDAQKGREFESRWYRKSRTCNRPRSVALWRRAHRAHAARTGAPRGSDKSYFHMTAFNGRTCSSAGNGRITGLMETIMTEHTDTIDAGRLQRIKRIAGMISREFDMPHQKALDAIARVRGHTHWGALAVSIGIEPDAIGAEFKGTISGMQTAQNANRSSPLLFDRPSDYGLDGIADVLTRIEAGSSLLIAGGISSLKDDLLFRMLLATRKKAHIGVLNLGDAYQIPHDRPNWDVATRKGCTTPEESERVQLEALRRYADKEKEIVFIEEYDSRTAMDAIIGTQKTIATVYTPTAEEAFDRIIELATNGWSEEDRRLRIERFRERLSAKFCIVGMGPGHPGTERGVVRTILPS